MAAAQLKLLAALPDQLRSAAERLTERFHLDAPPLLEAAFASPPNALRDVDDGTGSPVFAPYVVVAWDGRGGRDASSAALLLERRPASGSSFLVVTWAGGLGALAGVCEHGVVAQCELPSDRKETLSLAGVPFGIALARAIRFVRVSDRQSD